MQQGGTRHGRPGGVDGHPRALVRGKNISQIARLTGRDRKTIRRLLEHGQQPRKAREVVSKLDPFREYILGRMLAENDPVDNAEVIYDEICARGYVGGRSILKDFMQPFREMSRKKVTERFETPPGRQAQVDWGTFRKPQRKKVQGFVMTLGWSRASYLDFEDSQALPIFLACHERAFHYLGAVPEEILYDRAGTVWIRDNERGEPVFHPGLLDFAGHYGFRPRVCHGIKYVRRNFWVRVRDYETAADLLEEKTNWLRETCNVRVHGTTGERPVDRLPKEGLRSVEGVAPYRALVLERRRVARDCFLSYAGSWYSVPAEYAGKEVWVRQTESELVVGDRDQIIARHPLAERAYQRKVVPAHFAGMANDSDCQEPPAGVANCSQKNSAWPRAEHFLNSKG